MPDPSSPFASLAALATILGDVTRWRILLELAKGEALPVLELARRLHAKRNRISKHMAVLREARLVVVGFGRLYALAPSMVVRREEGVLDLGRCLVRLDALD